MYIGGGPYVAYAMHVTWFVNDTSLGSLFAEGSTFKRFDVGIKLAAGMKINDRVIIGAGYGFGSDINTNEFEMKTGY